MYQQCCQILRSFLNAWSHSFCTSEIPILQGRYNPQIDSIFCTKLTLDNFPVDTSRIKTIFFWECLSNKANSQKKSELFEKSITRCLKCILKWQKQKSEYLLANFRNQSLLLKSIQNTFLTKLQSVLATMRRNCAMPESTTIARGPVAQSNLWSESPQTPGATRKSPKSLRKKSERNDKKPTLRQKCHNSKSPQIMLI